MARHLSQNLDENQLEIINAIRTAATALWDVAETCWNTGVFDAGDWEDARCHASGLIAVLDHAPAPSKPWSQPIRVVAEVLVKSMEEHTRPPDAAC